MFNGIFVFDLNDLIYIDHFPGNAVVPGSLIVYAFMEAFKKHGISKKIKTISKFKFKSFLTPGEYDYSIQQIDELSLKCSIYKNNQIAVTGFIEISKL
ncbi:MAG: hypothetical protein HQK79_06290 [Desulfobacterales bacterium]|nr:hypothetical protein [Desulfobacterales bacterium]MBF0396668.1 hypothetical protein [Desulfobacterales bacterium]